MTLKTKGIIMRKGKVTYNGLKMLEIIITDALFLSGFTFTSIHNSHDNNH